MIQNMGGIDRIARIIIGIVLLVLAFIASPMAWYHWLMIGIGVVFIGTSAIGNCPLYSILGIKTCARK